MKNTIRLLILFLLLVVIPQGLFAQASLTQTALSAAIVSNANTMSVVSVTGFTASTNQASYYAYLDKEAVKILSISGTTLTIARGQLSTGASSHAINTPVLTYSGTQPGTTAAFQAKDQSGSCTRALQLVLPVINVTNGSIWDCPASSGIWQSSALIGAQELFPYASVTTTNYTASLADYYIDVGSLAAGAVSTVRTITFPAITGIFGKIYIVADHMGYNPAGCATSGCIVIAATAGQRFGSTVIGSSASITIASNTRNQTLMFISNGTGWLSFQPHVVNASNDVGGVSFP